jgi:hypothetical protein
MIVNEDLLLRMWGEIAEERSKSSEKSLAVFVSVSDVDSVCSTKVLMVRLACCALRRVAARACLRAWRQQGKH